MAHEEMRAKFEKWAELCWGDLRIYGTNGCYVNLRVESAWLGYQAAYPSAREEAIREAVEAVKGESIPNAYGEWDAAYNQALNDAEKAVLSALHRQGKRDARSI